MSGRPDFDTLEAAAEAKYGLPHGILRTTRIVETSGGHDVPGKPTKYGTAQGFYQTMPANVQKYQFNPHDPAQAVDGTARLWVDNLKAAGGNVQEAARMYNGSGPEARAYSQHWMHVYGGTNAPASAPSFTLGGDDEPAAPASAPSFTLGGDEPAPQASGAQSPAPEPTSAPPADEPAPQDTAKLEKDFLAGALPSAAPGDGKPAPIIDQFNAEVNKLAPHRPTPADIVRLGQNFGLTVDPKDAGTALDDYRHGRQATIHVPSAVRSDTPGYGEDAGQGLIQSARDMANLPGDAAAWADKNIPGVQSLDNMLARATGVQGNAIDQSAASHAITGAFGVGPYGQSWTGTGSRLAGDLAGSVAMGGPIEAGAARLAGAALTPDALAFAAGRGGSNLLTRGASLATRGATSGAMYGGLNEGSNNDGLGQNMLHGAEAGAIVAPALGSFAGRAAPSEADMSRAALAQTASDAGIPISVAQISRSPTIQRMGGMLRQVPGSGAPEFDAAQHEAFTRAASHTIGEDAPALSAQVMQNAKTNIGQRINDIASRNSITNTDELIHNLGHIEGDAELSLPESDHGPVKKQITNILGLVRDNQTIPGSVYQTLIQKGGPLDNLQSNSNTALANVGGKIRDALDDAFEASASPEDVDAFRAARLQYKNLKTLEKLAVKAPDGVISPALLQGAVNTSFKNRAYQGAAGLGDLANIGQAFLKSPSSSGTAENARALNRLTNIGRLATLGAGGLAGMHTGEIGALGGALAADYAGGVAAMPIARGLNKYMTNQGRVNKLIAATLNDNNAALPPIVSATVPVAAIGDNRLRAATRPK